MKHPSSEIQSSSVITSGTFNKTAGVDFSVNNLNFDGNGNILTMDQKGLKINTSSYIDRLTYTYQNNSNKLAQVTDAANDKNSKLGDFKYDPATKGSIDYGYDANGNLLSDANKNITNITYNYLNLPAAITVAGKGTINYTYDAAGNKLRKETTDNTINPARTTTTLYSNGLVYENDTLQYIAHEEGRIRPVRDASNNITNFTYDYFLKDHLGNVRMVLTEEQKTDAYPPASMETAQSTIENHFYSNINTTRIAKPAGYPTDTYTNPNDYVAKVRGDGNKIGPAIVLKVMVGDKFNLRCNSWWNSGSAPGTPVSPLNDLLSALAGSIGNISDGHGGATATEITNSGVLTPGVSNFLNSQSYNSSKPKAYINWILFDEQFKFVSSSSGFEQVGSNEEFKTHLFNDIAINKNGYLYVYVSNETPNIDVFFDNLQVTHTRGALLSEDHYYPFGLTMAGISSKALSFGSPQNKYKFNEGNELQSNEFSDGSGLEMYDAVNRMYDSQIGRFWQVDELAEANWEESTYSFAHNTPFLFNDPLGLEPEKGLTPETAKALPEVVVVATPKGKWSQQNLYYDINQILKAQNASIDQIAQPSLREMMYRFDGITNFRSKVAEMTRASDEFFLEAASWFMPVGWIAELKFAKYAAKLFKMKRGKVAAKIAEDAIVYGDEAAKGGTQAVEGIYEFTAASGKTYVGQSGNIAACLEQHIASGKLLPGTSVRTTEVLGGKTAREIAEQLRINSLGCIKYLENIRNPIGPARQYLLSKIP